MEPSYNIIDLLARSRQGGRVFARHGSRQFTGDDLSRLAFQAGNALRNLGAARGERAALLLLDAPEFIASFFGAAAVGVIPVPLNTMLAPGEYEFLLNHSGARVAVVSSALLPFISAVRGRCRRLVHVIGVGEARPDGATLWWNEAVLGASADLRPVETKAADPAFWLYSSGSAGKPKAVVHAHASVPFTCRHYSEEVLGLRPDDVCFSAAKMFHAYGLGNSMNFPLFVGAQTVLFSGPPLPEALFETMAQHRPSVFFATPSHYAGMLAAADSCRPCDLSSVRLCVSAGEALPADVFHRWKSRFGLEIVEGIGSTEMLHIFISNRPGEARAGSSGKPVPGYNVALLDESEQPIGTGRAGDLRVSGGSAALEYWGDLERTQAVLRGGCVLTGDKYKRDDEGFYWFQGRGDDMLKINGLWVSPAGLEQVLLQHPSVLECAIVARRDGYGLSQAKAFVVLREGESGSPAMARQLRAFFRQRSPQRSPKEFEFLHELPRTATGKVKRFQLRQMEAAA